jgi:hypothetical protein
MELDLNKISRASAPRIFEFTIAADMSITLDLFPDTEHQVR